MILDNNINQIHNPIKSRKHSRSNALVTQRLSQSTNGKTANHKEVQWNLTARGAAAEALSFSSKKGLVPIESHAAKCHHFRQPLIAQQEERGTNKRLGFRLPPLTFLPNSTPLARPTNSEQIASALHLDSRLLTPAHIAKSST